MSKEGTITDISFSDNIDSEAGVEFYSGILVPSFINTHNHVELSYLKGSIAEGNGFTYFARQISIVRDAFTDEEITEAVRRADTVMWNQGVGAVADICNGTMSFPIKRESPIYYRSFIELFGLSQTSADGLYPVAERAAKTGIDYCATPHSIYSLNDGAFRATVAGFEGQTGGDKAPISVHFMESPAEEEMYRSKGELWDWYVGERSLPVDFAHYGSPAKRIIASIPSDRKVLLIHNCLVTEEEVDMLTDHFGDNVTWVLCPRSNHYISRVAPPYKMLHRKGAKVAIGTDSLASNHSYSMIDEMKMLTGIPMEDLLWWATGSGADALGKEDVYGGFEVGKRCGGVIISGVDWDKMELTPDSKSERVF